MPVSKQRPMPPHPWNEEPLLSMDDSLFRTMVGLRMLADDHGRGTCTDWMVRPDLYRGRPEVTEDTLVDHFLQLHDLGEIGIYYAGDRSFYVMRVWPAVSHPAPSKFPAPPLELFQRFAGTEPDGFSAVEREGAGERGGAGEATSGGSGVAPSPFCLVHQPAGTREDCRHCGTARLAAREFERARRQEAQG